MLNFNINPCTKAILCVTIPSCMPVIKSAIKKVRQDKVKTARTLARKNKLKSLLKKARKNPSAKTLSAVFSTLDKAAKVKLIHRNKAARLKSQLSKLMVSK